MRATTRYEGASFVLPVRDYSSSSWCILLTSLCSYSSLLLLSALLDFYDRTLIKKGGWDSVNANRDRDSDADGSDWSEEDTAVESSAGAVPPKPRPPPLPVAAIVTVSAVLFIVVTILVLIFVVAEGKVWGMVRELRGMGGRCCRHPRPLYPPRWRRQLPVLRRVWMRRRLHPCCRRFPPTSSWIRIRLWLCRMRCYPTRESRRRLLTWPLLIPPLLLLTCHSYYRRGSYGIKNWSRSCAGRKMRGGISEREAGQFTVLDKGGETTGRRR